MWTDPHVAEDYFRRVLARDSQHAHAMCSLGHLLTLRNAEKEGVAWLTRAKRRRTAGGLPYVYLGHNAWRKGRAKDAEKAYRAAIKAAPGDPHPWFALGDLYLDLSRRLAARHAYEEALRVDPRCGDALLRLGRLHDKEDRTADAVKCFREGLEAAPHHPWRYEIEARLLELT